MGTESLPGLTPASFYEQLGIQFLEIGSTVWSESLLLSWGVLPFRRQ